MSWTLPFLAVGLVILCSGLSRSVKIKAAAVVMTQNADEGDWGYAENCLENYSGRFVFKYKPKSLSLKNNNLRLRLTTFLRLPFDLMEGSITSEIIVVPMKYPIKVTKDFSCSDLSDKMPYLKCPIKANETLRLNDYFAELGLTGVFPGKYTVKMMIFNSQNQMVICAKDINVTVTE